MFNRIDLYVFILIDLLCRLLLYEWYERYLFKGIVVFDY